MKVILNDHVEHLGERGQVVDVKPGYARNYLLPKGVAYLDTPGNRRRYEEEQKSWEEMDLKRKSAAEQVAASLQGVELLFERRAGETDVLFGSVTAQDIASELAERGIEIDKRRVVLASPIKELGNFEIAIRVHREIEVTVPIHVVRPGQEPEPETEEAAMAPAPAEGADAAMSAVEALLDETGLPTA